MFFYFDPTYILIVPALIFAMWAQVRVNTTFRKYLRYLLHQITLVRKWPGICWMLTDCKM